MVRKLISSVVIASLTATGADAALLANVQGSVTVNRGEGFQPAQNGTAIGPGDRVRVDEGSAEIVYDNGYVVRVGPGQMVAVLYTPPAVQTASAGSSTMTYVYVGGGLLAAGGIGAGAMLLLNNNSNNNGKNSSKPASP